MAAILPFIPNVQSGVAGFTVALTVPTTPFIASGSVPASGTGGLGESPSLLVTNAGANTTWVRISVESSTVAGATVSVTDTPMPANTVRLFADPNPIGATGIAVIGTAAGNVVFFTPGEGGV